MSNLHPFLVFWEISTPPLPPPPPRFGPNGRKIVVVKWGVSNRNTTSKETHCNSQWVLLPPQHPHKHETPLQFLVGFTPTQARNPTTIYSGFHSHRNTHTIKKPTTIYSGFVLLPRQHPHKQETPLQFLVGFTPPTCASRLCFHRSPHAHKPQTNYRLQWVPK